MNVEHLPLASVHPAPGNARAHPPEQIAKLVDSMREFGFPQPILVNADGRIIAGHGRLEAARTIYAGGGAIPHLSPATVPVVRVEGLSEDEQRAYRIADNRLAELSVFDPLLLANELSELSGEGFDSALLGFSAMDMLRLDEDTARAQLQGMAEPAAEPAPAAAAANDSEPHERTVRFDVLIPAVDRQIVYDALVKARTQFAVNNTGDALASLLDFVGASL
jgi:ParB-like chromosome segregation protein Spo0J